MSAVRVLLRYLFAHGKIATDLTGAIPAVAGWRLTGIPQDLDPAVVAQIVRACDGRTHEGCRTRAAVLLMVRLGLRVGEVAALRLDDVDWRAGEIVIRGKGRRTDRLPLPVDVGRRRRRVCATTPPADRDPGAVSARACAASSHRKRRTQECRAGRVPSRGRAGNRDTPPATHGRQSDAASGELPVRDRTGTSAPSPRHDRDLRESRSRGAARRGAAMAGRCPVTALRDLVAEYLALRRALGYTLHREGWLLPRFVTFLESRGQAWITTPLAMAWASEPVGATPSTTAHRLTIIRGFAEYVRAQDRAPKSLHAT